MRAFPYSKNKKVYFIAEIGSNHNQDQNRLEQLILWAKAIGCDAVKLQYFKADRLWAPEFKKTIQKVKKQELTYDMLCYANKICKQAGIALHCSVFDPHDVWAICTKVDALKVASYECQWELLTQTCMQTQKPLMISTGTCTPREILAIEDMIRKPKEDDCIFHCFSMYPAQTENSYMQHFINLLGPKTRWKNIGWSDHTRKPQIVIHAIQCGANVIECHFDLQDQNGSESIHGHCWSPEELRAIINHSQHTHIVQNQMINISTSMNIIMNRPDLKESGLRTDKEDGLRPLRIYRGKYFETMEQG